MGVVALIMLCLLLSHLQTQQTQSQPLHNRRVAELQHLLDLELPRKLRISKELPTKFENAEEDDECPGKEEQIREIDENGEWVEDDPLEHFTMDYTSVKRRRPIHNMSTQHP